MWVSSQAVLCPSWQQQPAQCMRADLAPPAAFSLGRSFALGGQVFLGASLGVLGSLSLPSVPWLHGGLTSGSLGPCGSFWTLVSPHTGILVMLRILSRPVKQMQRQSESRGVCLPVPLEVAFTRCCALLVGSGLCVRNSVCTSVRRYRIARSADHRPRLQ